MIHEVQQFLKVAVKNVMQMFIAAIVIAKNENKCSPTDEW